MNPIAPAIGSRYCPSCPVNIADISSAVSESIPIAPKIILLMFHILLEFFHRGGGGSDPPLSYQKLRLLYPPKPLPCLDATAFCPRVMRFHGTYGILPPSPCISGCSVKELRPIKWAIARVVESPVQMRAVLCFCRLLRCNRVIRRHLLIIDLAHV